MKTIVLTLGLCALALLPTLPAQEKEANEPADAARRLLEVMKFESSGVDAALASFEPVLNQFRTQGLPEEAVTEIELAARGYFTKVMTDEGLRNDVAKLYGELFNEDELEELLAFYQTPVGQKALFEMPKVLGEAMKLGQKHAEKYAPDFQKEVQAIVEKHQGGAGEDAPDDEGAEEAPENKE